VCASEGKPIRIVDIRLVATASVVVLLASLAIVTEAKADPVPVGGVVAVHNHRCGRADLPETGIQGDVPRDDQTSGRAEQGYNCGLALVGHATLSAQGRQATGNANMAWAGDCAYVSGPGAVFGQPSPEPGHGVAVVDVSDPAHPRHVRTLRSPGAVAAMETVHAMETPTRSVLVVGQYGNQAGGDKPMDIYDVSDCAKPRLLQTFIWPENIHNLTISGNGRYVFATQPLQVADIDPLFDADPRTKTTYLGDLEADTPGLPFAVGPSADLDDALPEEVRGAWQNYYLSHEAWPNAAGTKVYLGGQLPVFESFTILDITKWLKRNGKGQPAGPPRIISQRSGRGHSVRTATIGGKPYVLHSEESVFGPTWGCLPESANPFLGPAQPWLTDISDERSPKLVSQFGLEINNPENCPAQIASEVSASVHYHDVDDAKDTTFVMASMWNSGVRLFDVRKPARPVEVAYFNPGDVDPTDGVTLDHAWGHIRWVPETGHVWFATSAGGFWVVEIEPQVRRLLGLDAKTGHRPTLRHPAGRPGRQGVRVSAATLGPDVSPMSCTVGGLTYQAP
jgi:LVIVD repeat-containing protein